MSVVSFGGFSCSISASSTHTACSGPHCTDMAHHSVVKLRDGRLLSYRLAGYPVESPHEVVTTLSADIPRDVRPWRSQPTVVYHHGWPSSAAEVLAWDKPAAEQGVHVVAVDRPGVGFSTFNPSGTFASYAEDVAELISSPQLANVIHIGTSGGGPYACACAALQPSTTAALGLVASMTHVAGPGSFHLASGMDWFNRLGFSAIAYTPKLVRLGLALAAPRVCVLAESLAGVAAAAGSTQDLEEGRSSPGSQSTGTAHPAQSGVDSTVTRLSGSAPGQQGAGVVGTTAGQLKQQMISQAVSSNLLGKAALYVAGATLPSPDRAALLHKPGVFLEVLPSVLADAFRQGHRGFFADMRLTTMPWDFNLGSIKAPAVVCQGDADVNVTVNMAKWFGEQIPGAEVRVFPGEAHFSLVANHADEVLRMVLQKAA